ARVFSGDPFLFRSGDDEVAQILKEGIAIEIVAGVTTAVSAYAGLALVRSSDASPSVAFAAIPDMTDLHDWSKLALATDTLCLMTNASLVSEIVSTLVYYGRAPTTPAAIVRDVSRPTQTVILGQLGSLEARKLSGEVMLVVGEPISIRES